VAGKTPDISGASVILLDADPDSARELKEALAGFGGRVYSAKDESEASGIFTHKTIHALLVDVNLLAEGSEDFLREYKSANPAGMLFLTIEPATTVAAPESSAFLVDDYLEKPVEAVGLARMLETGASTALEVADPLMNRVRPYFRFRSDAMRLALRDLPRIASSHQTVLITGETGTGKEIISRAIHVMSPRSAGSFVAVNCGAIPESLIEGELFGHEKGAFTGADRMRRGKFEIAGGGTLLLDEIAEMPVHLQARLLRVLEEGQIYRVGGESPVRIDVRVIAATNRDLAEAVKDGLFREDLYYRLNVLRMALPPLSERTEDISLLAVHFMERALAEMGVRPPYPTLSTAAMNLLEGLPWRGNVRELRNVMTRVATLLPRSARKVLPMHVLPHVEDRRAYAPGPAGEEGTFVPAGTPMDRAEEMLILSALEQTGGNRTKAAKLLGIGLRTLRRKINKK
jgi:DNA-binding NtrC family response regulator